MTTEQERRIEYIEKLAKGIEALNQSAQTHQKDKYYDRIAEHAEDIRIQVHLIKEDQK